MSEINLSVIFEKLKKLEEENEILKSKISQLESNKIKDISNCMDDYNKKIRFIHIVIEYCKINKKLNNLYEVFLNSCKKMNRNDLNIYWVSYRNEERLSDKWEEGNNMCCHILYASHVYRNNKDIENQFLRKINDRINMMYKTDIDILYNDLITFYDKCNE